MDRIELGIPVEIAQKCEEDRNNVKYEALPNGNITLSSLQFVIDNIEIIDIVIITLLLLTNFLPMMMGYTYYIDTDEMIDDDARVTESQFQILYTSARLKIALAVSIVSSSLLLLNNWELMSTSNQTSVKTTTQIDNVNDADTSVSSYVDQLSISTDSMHDKVGENVNQDNFHLKNISIAFLLLIPDLYLLIVAIPLKQVDFVHAMLPARDTIYVFFFVKQLKLLNPKIWNWRVHYTVSYTTAVCNLLINLGIFITTDISIILIILMAVAIFDTLVCVVLHFQQFEGVFSVGFHNFFTMINESSQNTVLTTMYSTILLVYILITWYVVFHVNGSCYYTCLLGEGYFVIYTYLITFISVVISLVTTHIDRTKSVNISKQKFAIETLVNKMLPASKVATFKKTGRILPELHYNTCLFFSDIEGFTAITSNSQPYQVMLMLNSIYTLMDYVALKFPRLYKIETIGDAYVIASGLFNPDDVEENIVAMANFALIVREVVNLVINPQDNVNPIRIRVGIHAGDVLSGVVGNLMPRWCLFGDAMNMTSRLETSCESGKIHVSIQAAKHLKKSKQFIISKRGLVTLKGKGEVTTYYLESASEDNKVSNIAAIETLLEECRALLAVKRHENRRNGGKLLFNFD